MNYSKEFIEEVLKENQFNNLRIIEDKNSIIIENNKEMICRITSVYESEKWQILLNKVLVKGIEQMIKESQRIHHGA